MAAWRALRSEVHGLSLSTTRTGGGGVPVVLLHGLTGSGACWTPVARALEGDHDVVMPDARGHGDSGAPAEGGYRYDDLAGDVLAVMDALALGAPVLVGHSMGGLTAAVVAARAPRRLRGLVLVDPTFLEPERQREVFESDVAEQHRRSLARSRDELVAEQRRRQPRRAPELVEQLVDARLRTDVRAWEILTPPNPDFRGLVRAIAVPTLLVLGDERAGAVVSREVAGELAATNARLRVEEIAGAGHGVPYDQPERVAGAVRAFVATLGPSPGP